MSRFNKCARSQGMIGCKHCHTVTKLPEEIGAGECIRCPVCHAKLESRIPQSWGRTLALVLAATFMFIPANILPIMNVTYLGTGTPDTIIAGVLKLMQAGMWPLALIVFVASFVVPIMKIVVLFGLLISVKIKSRWRPIGRTRLFKVTEFVGRWSMVDIFVLAILVALVQFGNLASVDAGLGALSFAAVVILTMLAAHTFDQRLIWDAMAEEDS